MSRESESKIVLSQEFVDRPSKKTIGHSSNENYHGQLRLDLGKIRDNNERLDKEDAANTKSDATPIKIGVSMDKSSDKENDSIHSGNGSNNKSEIE